MQRERLLKIAKIAWTVLVYIFAAIGFLLIVAYFAVRFGFTNVTGIIDQQRQAFLGTASSTAADSAPTYPNGTPWQDTQEWQVLSAAITKDAPVIDQAAQASGVPARLIVSSLVVEQLRLFFTERGYYEQFFAPLKILGSQTQFSWGVMGMKEDTAVQVENNLKDPSSPFYPGSQYASLLDFPNATSTSSTTISEERFTRMTDQHNHYYNYLYAGLAMKQIETQWQNAGFPIANNPAVISTLYNIGFQYSVPKADPQIGGAAIVINGVTYSFGGLAEQFYTSNLLSNLFPQQ
ncbi:MAG: hypothetical protein P4M11_05890 [Candidatus Pacebacteria bacterium]|nr:hypothetical protein [Candidatus Paceibacterota bacterium]